MTILESTPLYIEGINEWLCHNAGKTAVAKKITNNSFQLLAIEDSDVASTQITNYAKHNNGIVLVGISKGESNAID